MVQANMALGIARDGTVHQECCVALAGWPGCSCCSQIDRQKQEAVLLREEMKKEYAEASDKKLLALHQGIVRACERDRSMTTAMQEAAQAFGSPLKYCGVDEFPDWKIQGEALEAELTIRSIAFAPLKF